MHVWGLLERAAALHPRAVAVVDGESRATYAETRARCAGLAAFLREHGVARGDRVSILAWNGRAFFESYFAIAALGAIANPLNVRQSPQELAAILRDCGSCWVIADPSLAELVLALSRLESPLAQVVWTEGPAPVCALSAFAYEDCVAFDARSFEPARPNGGDVAQLYYTSGTTGRAKGVMLTQHNVTLHAISAIAELALCETDRWAHIAPMFHLADAWATFAITWVGGTHVMLPRFEAALALDLLERERVTLSNLVPTMLNLMVKHPGAHRRDFSALRMILSGGAPIATEVVRAIVETFRCEYVQTYGMTETSPYLTLGLLKEHLRALPPDEQLVWRAKTGRPFAPIELEVVDEDGHHVSPDGTTVGEIRVRGETVMLGYWNQPEETRAAFVDGWFQTGDLAVVDTEGYVTIVDRKKDMIITGGEKVYSTEVENVLYAHPAVLEAAVFGMPDEVWGETVCAAIVLREGAKIDRPEIERLCRAQLSSFKVPRTIELVPHLPRTGSGKIQKSKLKEAASAQGKHSLTATDGRDGSSDRR